jgi:GntP family gluconate:H+ symporter
MDPLLILLVGIVVVIGGILFLRLHAFLALLLGALAVALLTPTSALENYAESQVAAQKFTQKEAEDFPKQSIGKRIAEKFGATAAKIGILIAMAAIIGKCMLESGAADKIVRASLRLVGIERAPFAFLGSSFLLAIPVFFDTVFYLMIPLGKAAALRNAKKYGLYVLAILAGGTMAHSLVPPTPGPLFVASELGVDIGKMMLGGIVVGCCTCFVGYQYIKWANVRWPIPLRDSAESPLADLEKQSQVDESKLPPLLVALLPIVLPVILIAGGTFLKSDWLKTKDSLDVLRPFFGFFGDKNVALITSAAIAMATVAWIKKTNLKDLAASMQGALGSGGLIILITSAGGGFGGILQQSGIADRIQELAPASQSLTVLVIAFFATAIVRAAQGSATVAMITAVGILSGFGNAELGFDPVYLALAIGCGSKPFPWMNDSGFWVISKMSGMTEGETLRTVTVLLTIMGFVGLFVTLLLAWLLPFPFGQ